MLSLVRSKRSTPNRCRAAEASPVEHLQEPALGGELYATYNKKGLFGKDRELYDIAEIGRHGFSCFFVGASFSGFTMARATTNSTN